SRSPRRSASSTTSSARSAGSRARPPTRRASVDPPSLHAAIDADEERRPRVVLVGRWASGDVLADEALGAFRADPEAFAVRIAAALAAAGRLRLALAGRPIARREAAVARRAFALVRARDA